MAGTDAGYCARKGKQLNLTLSPGCDANFLLTAKTTRRGVKGTFIDNQKLIFGIDDANDVSTSVINQFQGEPDCMNVYDNEDGSRVAVVSGPYSGRVQVMGGSLPILIMRQMRRHVVLSLNSGPLSQWLQRF